MISFFNVYPDFSPQEEAIAIEALEEIAAEYSLIADYVNVIFLTDDQLLQLNIEYLKHDYYTDIITFNYSELPRTLEAELYISIDRVKENAETNNVSMNDEMCRVIIHGILHLAGFDDQTESDKSEMRQLEDKFLKQSSFHVKQDNDKISA